MTLQGLILKLSEFWASHGCVLQQPLDLEVGAGTMHPETFLRVLGPTHWNVAYVQPSRRPADGRFGENPNRLFKHHQFQVILKPAPDEVQQLYLESLEACGINPRQHDVRFEEDNWESPTLGAWGIGWQVLFDGMEISQFTYFQQAGGIELAPVSAELTYGLERIAMSLQRVDSIFDIEWGAGIEARRSQAARRDRAVEIRLRPGGYAARGVRRVPSRSASTAATTSFAETAAEDGAYHGRRSSIVSSARTSSTSSTRATASASPNGLPTSCAFASSPSGSRKPTWRNQRVATEAPSAEAEELMDRELLLEIGCEELPASWLPGLDSRRSGMSWSPRASTRCASRRKRRLKPTVRRGA